MNRVSETTVPSPSSEKAPTTITEKLNSLESSGVHADPTPPAENEVTKPDAAVTDGADDTDDFSSRFAMLAKKERRLSEERKAIEKERQENLRLRETLAKAKEDPDAYLQQAGLSIDQIIEHKLKGLEPPDPDARVVSVEEKIKQVEAELKRRDDESERLRIDSAVKSFTDGIRQHVESRAEDFGLIAGFDRHDAVFETCKQYFEETGERLDLDRACKLVEAEIERDIEKALKIPKIQRLAQSKFSGLKSDIRPAAPDIQPSTTLNNRAVSPAQQDNPGRLLSREESLARSAKFLEMELAKSKR